MAPVSSKDKKETQHIQAFVRLRPFNKTELETHSKRILEISDKEISVLLHHGSKRFTFDRVFSMNSKQKEIYSTIIKPIISEVMQGYNCTVFAYGQTGTGKTYTMIGNPTENYSQDSDCGIIPRTLEHLFETLAKNSELDFTIRISYLEIYNEILIDLLSNEDKCLKIYEDQKHKGSVQIHGLEEVTIFDKSEVYQILQTGNEKKATFSTMMNSQSSRSHTVFTITLHSKETTPEGEELVKTGKLNLVDLAGSENISRSGAIDKRAREAGNINQSLLTLGRVIKGLVEKNAHIPYRESKLTRILQDSLGGKTKTTIIATVSPASSNLDETLSTLDYAFRARNITNRPEINQKTSKTALIQKYLEEIDRLKKDLHANRNSEGVYLNVENYNVLVEESERRKEDLARAIEDCTHFEGRIEELERIKSELEQVYSVTKTDLAEAEENLSKLRKSLKRFRKQRRDCRDLIERFDEVQEVLFEQRRDLQERLQDVADDNECLKVKVEDLYGVIGRNDVGCKEFYSFSNEKFKNIAVNFADISEFVLGKSKDMKVDLLDSCVRSKEALVELKDRTVNFEMLFGETLEKLQEEISGYHKEDFDFLVEELRVSEDVAEKILKAFAKKKSNLQEKLEHLQRILQVQRIANENLYCEFLDDQEDFARRVCAGFEQVSLKQIKFGEYFEEKLREFEAKQKLLKESVEDLETNQKCLQVKLAGSYEKIRSKFNELIDENLRNLGENFVNERNVLEKHKIRFEDFAKEPQKLFIAHEVFKGKTVEICEENLENVKVFKEQFQEKLLGNSIVKEIFLKEIGDCYRGVKVVLEGEEVEECLKGLETRRWFEEEIEQRCLKQNKIKGEVEVLVGRIGEFLGGFKSKCGVLEEFVRKSSSFQGDLEEFERVFKEKFDENSSNLESLRDVLGRFVDNFEVVSPSGRTPVGKKEFAKFETPLRVLNNISDLSFEECQTEEESANEGKVIGKLDNFKENICDN